MAGAWYNENDRQKAAWLRVLIGEGLIAPGVVDERSITEVRPLDLEGFGQCHFFAGVGIWSLAARRAGIPDDEPVWTGSCPCGPFSRAGKQAGFADPRHLWPAWLPLIRVRRPHRIFGEQSDAADAWIDLVSADLEDLGYAFGSPDIPAAGFEGAHIRQRFYWVADADNAEWWSERAPWHDGHWPKTGRVKSDRHAGHGGADEWLADAHGGGQSEQPQRISAGAAGGPGAGGRGYVVGLGHADGERTDRRGLRGAGRAPSSGQGEVGEDRRQRLRPVAGRTGQLVGLVGATGGRLRMGSGGVSYVHQPDGSGAADWLLCRDSVWRPVEPGTCPLVDAAPVRMGRLRGYGDAIDAEAATQFIAAYLDAAPE